MATLKEKEQTLERLKGPHFYRIMLSGYGAECSYMRISKEAFDFWSKTVEEHGDADAIHYILNASDQTRENVGEDSEYEYIDGSDIPREAMFMHDDDEEHVGATWYEPIDEFDHTWGVTYDAANLTIDKVDSAEYSAKYLEEVVDGEELGEWINEVSERNSDPDNNIWCEPTEVDHDYGNKYPEKGRYICQVISAEKGTFFETVIETPGLFDETKLKWMIAEAPNGEDLIYGAEYDGEEVYNDGGDTTGKGYYVYFYKQEY